MIKNISRVTMNVCQVHNYVVPNCMYTIIQLNHRMTTRQVFTIKVYSFYSLGNCSFTVVSHLLHKHLHFFVPGWLATGCGWVEKGVPCLWHAGRCACHFRSQPGHILQVRTGFHRAVQTVQNTGSQPCVRWRVCEM